MALPEPIRTEASEVTTAAEAGSDGSPDDPFHSELTRPAPLQLRNEHGLVMNLVAGQTILLGRSQRSPIAASATDNISSEHAEIRTDDTGSFLTDTGSTNGTVLNGKRVQPFASVYVPPGSTIELANDPAYRIVVQQGSG